MRVSSGAGKYRATETKVRRWDPVNLESGRHARGQRRSRCRERLSNVVVGGENGRRACVGRQVDSGGAYKGVLDARSTLIELPKIDLLASMCLAGETDGSSDRRRGSIALVAGSARVGGDVRVNGVVVRLDDDNDFTSSRIPSDRRDSGR